MKPLHACLAALAIAVGVILFAAGAGLLMGLCGLLMTSLTGWTFDSGWIVLIVMPVLWSLLPDRFKALHRPYEIRGDALIGASPSEVWDTVLPRPGREHFLNSISRVESVEGRPDRLDLHSDSDGFNGPLPPLQAVLEEVEPKTYFRLSYLNADAYPLMAGDLVRSEYYLEAEDGKTRVTLIETLDKLRLSTVLLLLLLNPCRDSARRIKALCEGTPDQSRMTRMSNNLDTHKDGTVGNRDVMWVGLLTCVFLTLICGGMVYGILAFVSVI